MFSKAVTAVPTAFLTVARGNLSEKADLELDLVDSISGVPSQVKFFGRAWEGRGTVWEEATETI